MVYLGFSSFLPFQGAPSTHPFSPMFFQGAIVGPEGEFCRFKSDGYLGFPYEILVLPLVSYLDGYRGQNSKNTHHPEKMYECAGLVTPKFCFGDDFQDC